MKKEAKHTPGPIINDGETPKGVMLLAGPEDRETVIYLQGPERQQYARLFAAAPELLEACKAVDEWLMEGFADSDADDPVYNESFRRALRTVRAAIANATGQEG